MAESPRRLQPRDINANDAPSTPNKSGSSGFLSKLESIIPSLPPPALTRNGPSDAPHTPIKENFMSPSNTPQGSPSKNRNPPGAKPVLKAASSKNSAQTDSNGPTQSLQSIDERSTAEPTSPTRRSNKENTPPSSKLTKDLAGMRIDEDDRSSARVEAFQRAATTKRLIGPNRGLTAEELEKIKKPEVKRIANAAQLCKSTPLLVANHTDLI
jgi:cell cycle protein kinase DBF2